MEAEFWVSAVHLGGMGVATVQFDVVYVPWRKSVGVDLQVSQNAGIPSASIVPVVFVYPEF